MGQIVPSQGQTETSTGKPKPARANRGKPKLPEENQKKTDLCMPYNYSNARTVYVHILRFRPEKIIMYSSQAGMTQGFPMVFPLFQSIAQSVPNPIKVFQTL